MTDGYSSSVCEKTTGTASSMSPEAGQLADPRFATPEGRDRDIEALGVALAQWCAGPLQVPGGRRARPAGYAPSGPTRLPDDLLVSEQLRQRGFFQEVDDGRGGMLDGARRPVPDVSHSREVRAGAGPWVIHGFRSERVGATCPSSSGLAGCLEGVRVLDFTWAAAGPYATLLLALLGAEVVKVESSRRPDPARRGFLADYGGINRSPNFNELNLNKRAIQVDLDAARRAGAGASG